jgi:dihydrofolate reductase
VHFYTDNIKDLVLKLKSEPGGVIFCDGGAEIANMLLSEGLIDEFIISVVPILVGEGIRLFKDGRPELPLQLIAATSFDTGLVQMHYKRTSP